MIEKLVSIVKGMSVDNWCGYDDAKHEFNEENWEWKMNKVNVVSTPVDVLTMQNVNNLVSTKESRAKVLSVMNENETKMFKRFVKSVIGR